MSSPAEDWQERIEAGLPYYRDPFEQPAPSAGATPPPPQATPGATPRSSGPVYGTPGTGPAPQQFGSPQFGSQGFGSQGFGSQRSGATLPGFPRPDFTQQFAAVPGYGHMAADAGAPFGRDVVTGEPLSDKSKVPAGLLQLLLPFAGVCGVGRIYIGSTTIGLVQLIGFFVAVFMSMLLIGIPFVIGIWLWSFIDGILMLAGSVRDPQGRKLRG